MNKIYYKSSRQLKSDTLALPGVHSRGRRGLLVKPKTGWKDSFHLSCRGQNKSGTSRIPALPLKPCEISNSDDDDDEKASAKEESKDENDKKLKEECKRIRNEVSCINYQSY
jgi:hypothetical protein